MVWDELSFEEFQDGSCGGHIGYRNGTVLAILNLYVTLMPPIEFWLNPTYGLVEMSFEEFQDGRHWNCDGHLGYRDGMVLAILNLYVASMPHIKFLLNLAWFGRICHLKNFKMAALAAILVRV